MFINPVCADAALANVQICHPKYLTVREILAIIDHPSFKEYLDEPILSIQKNENGYLVVTASHEMQVDVKHLPPLTPMIGGNPRFELFFHDPIITDYTNQTLLPKYQAAEEIHAILKDQRLFEKLGNEIVQEVRKCDGGYVIVTRSFEFQVDVNYIGESAQFDLVFHDPAYSPNIVS